MKLKSFLQFTIFVRHKKYGEKSVLEFIILGNYFITSLWAKSFVSQYQK